MLQDFKDMQFVWAGEREEKNQRLRFAINKKIDSGELVVFAADFYQVFADGKLVSYGPERTAAGYARIRRILLNNVKKIEVLVSAYNASVYCCDMQLPYFSARILMDGKAIAETEDFICTAVSEKIVNVPRYSFQRMFVEVYNYFNVSDELLTVYPVSSPILLGGNGDNIDYSELSFRFVKSGIFKGFEEVCDLWWRDSPLCATPSDAFDVKQNVAINTIGNFVAYDYVLDRESAGFLRFDVDANEPITFYAVFDEYVEADKWKFRRSHCNDCVCYTLPKGKYSLITAEPYVLKFLKILQKGMATIKPSLVTVQNKNSLCVRISGNNEIVSIFDSAVASFRHNVTDIYMDCPSRERAGWLFDSRFTALTERMLYGNNNIERAFLENFNICDTPELDEGMIPDCFPAQHNSGEFIPNYAMWYVIEVFEYFKRTGDRTIVDGAKKKAYGLYEYFKRFINEDGLLENLEGWVFVEWSVANSKEYTCGVNYPSNMVYAEMLRVMGEAYGDVSLTAQAEDIRRKVLAQSYTGEFFVDNATRENGKLIRRDDHISETCQYYALMLGYCPDDAFRCRMINEFGPFRRAGMHPNIERSNMLPGHYLRFTWLLENGENDRVIRELCSCVKHMVECTGTLWENDKPTDSLDHGFASTAAVLLISALTGYKTIKNGKPVFGERAKEVYGVKVDFNYDNYCESVMV